MVRANNRAARSMLGFDPEAQLPAGACLDLESGRSWGTRS